MKIKQKRKLLFGLEAPYLHSFYFSKNLLFLLQLGSLPWLKVFNFQGRRRTNLYIYDGTYSVKVAGQSTYLWPKWDRSTLFFSVVSACSLCLTFGSWLLRLAFHYHICPNQVQILILKTNSEFQIVKFSTEDNTMKKYRHRYWMVTC